MKFCPECGKQISGNEKYCSQCGYKIPADLKGYHPGSDEIKVELDGSADPLSYSGPASQKKYPTEGKKILIDYFEKTVGTPVGRPYHEMVLYTFSDDELLKEEYLNGGAENELCIQKLVPHQAYEDAMNVVKTFHLKQLLGRKGHPLAGKVYVIRFREDPESEELYRFSSDNVGREETMMMFPQMRDVLSEY